MKKRVLWAAVFVGVVAVAVCAVAVWNHHAEGAARKFRAVEPGKIYAGAYLPPKILRDLMTDQGIRNVLSLRSEDDEDQLAEKEVLEAIGVPLHNIILKFDAPSRAKWLMRAEEAADFLADAKNQPVFVHCWGGRHRAGAVVAIYRIKHCGWTFEAAKDELARYGGLSQRGPLMLLEAYVAQSTAGKATVALPSNQDAGRPVD